MLGLLMTFAISSSSCKSDPRSVLKNGSEGKAIVLVAGYELSGSNHVAKYWIDGQESVLSDGTNDAYANSIFVSGNTVYNAGTDGVPVYWQNNMETKLPINSSYGDANSVFVSGNDVYVAGTDSTKAAFWKNGKETILDNVTDSGSIANSVVVSGADVYVAGKRGYNAVYWENGIIHYLTGDNVPTQNIKIRSIAVSNGDVYETGTVLEAASPFPYIRYWAKGVAVDLNTDYDLSSPHNGYGMANAVYLSGNDIYICGMVETTNQMINNAVYWKNGVETVLPSSATNSYASSIFVSGSDVYIAGYEYNANQTKYAVYWKNGIETKLTDGTNNAFATSIFIKQ